jgi:hypothetical protein
MKRLLIALALLLPLTAPTQTELEKQIIEIIEKGIFYTSTTHPLSNLKNFNIYPNPTKETINIAFNSNISNEIEIKFISLRGVVVLETTANIDRGRNHIALNINKLPTGTYILYLQTGSEIETNIVNITTTL